MSVSCGPGGPEVEWKVMRMGGKCILELTSLEPADFFMWFDDRTNSSKCSCRHTLGFLAGKETWAMWYETLNGKRCYLQFQFMTMRFPHGLVDYAYHSSRYNLFFLPGEILIYVDPRFLFLSTHNSLATWRGLRSSNEKTGFAPISDGTLRLCSQIEWCN